MQETMRKWQEAATPGQQYRFLDAMIGKWKTKSTMWMGPGQPPMGSAGEPECRWILDGRYVLMELKGQVMGQPPSRLGHPRL